MAAIEGAHVSGDFQEAGASDPLVHRYRTQNTLDTIDHRNVETMSDEDGISDETMDGEDASSLIGVSISRAATRLTSAKTPAAEKAAAMDYLEGGGYFVDTDDDITPPAEPNQSFPLSGEQGTIEGKGQLSNSQLGELPPRDSTPDNLPSPWIAGPRQLTVERSTASRSVLRDALGPGVLKRRSSSGSGDNLRKYLPSLPSLPNVGQFLPSLNLPSFSSHNANGQKSRSRGFSLASTGSPPKSPWFTSQPHSPVRASTLSSHKTKQDPNSGEKTSLGAMYDGPADHGPPRPKPLRRVTSDQSLLYHSLSRSSSLGDDTRFENHHEMVNSRVKAIRDSLQDRSSFRLPSMPSMPRSPSFSRAMSFMFDLNSGNVSPKTRIETDTDKGLLPGTLKKRSGVPPNVAADPGLVDTGSSTSVMAEEAPQPIVNGPDNDSFERALANLTGDVVIMGGYRGSILRSAKPPHRQLWVPVKVGLNIRRVDLEVGLEPEDEERMEETIFSSGMLQNIGPVDISRRLFKRLRESENAKNGSLRIWDYGYDWRLSPHLLSRKLISFLEGLPSNLPARKDGGAMVIAHSLGGLITRHAVNKRPELFSGVVYAGVPQACVNILGPIRNGDAVLLSSRVLTAQVNFTLRTTFALLPLEGYCFEDKYTKEQYKVDYFNVDDWIKYRWSPCTDPPLPPKNPQPSGIAGLLKSGSSSNLQLPFRKGSLPSHSRDTSPAVSASVNGTTSQADNSSTTRSNSPPSHLQRAADAVEDAATTDRTIAPQMGNLSNPVNKGQSINTSVSTLVTIPRPKAIAYLRRVLAEVKQFKEELAFQPELGKANSYPPLAVIYGKSVPTVYAARVDGRDGIACADSYDDLAFASGDGVCLAKEAMLPDGYMCVQGGRISSDRGHVTLLGDLNAVGRAMEAIMKGRAKGLGKGSEHTHLNQHKHDHRHVHQYQHVHDHRHQNRHRKSLSETGVGGL